MTEVTTMQTPIIRTLKMVAITKANKAIRINTTTTNTMTKVLLGSNTMVKEGTEVDHVAGDTTLKKTLRHSAISR